MVVLPLVRLVPLEPGLAAAAAADADPELEKQAAIAPAPDLGADDGGGGVALRGQQQVAQGVGLGGAVVVQEPQPLDAGSLDVGRGQPGRTEVGLDGSADRLAVRRVLPAGR